MITKGNIEHLSVNSGGGWQEGILTYNVDGTSFTPAEYKIYRMLKDIETRLIKLEGVAE